jgi:hypothetical protein
MASRSRCLIPPSYDPVPPPGYPSLIETECVSIARMIITRYSEPSRSVPIDVVQISYTQPSESRANGCPQKVARFHYRPELSVGTGMAAI